MLRRATKTRGLADRRFVEFLPRGFRPHKGLVVKSRAEKRREQAVDRQHIEIERRPAILAQRVEAVVKLGRRRAGIGLAPRAIAQFDQRIRLLGPVADNAARTMIFERAPDQLDVIGQQGRGERVARKAAETLAVEGEALRSRAVDRPAGCEAAHDEAPSSQANCTREICMAAHVARHPDPAAAPGRMNPIFVLRAGKIVAQIDIIVKGPFRIGAGRIGPLLGRVAEIGIFLGVARAAIGTDDLHQCRLGWAPTPFSSMTWPVRKRSRR